jgi:hypothetical protein
MSDFRARLPLRLSERRGTTACPASTYLTQSTDATPRGSSMIGRRNCSRQAVARGLNVRYAPMFPHVSGVEPALSASRRRCDVSHINSRNHPAHREGGRSRALALRLAAGVRDATVTPAMRLCGGDGSTTGSDRIGGYATVVQPSPAAATTPQPGKRVIIS